jgi:hypothetical protein
MGERQKLDKNIQVHFDDDDDVIITEKIDGVNARLIFTPDLWSPRNDYFIASREELLHAKGDRIWIPTGDIVETVLPFVRALRYGNSALCVVFGEVFGGKTTKGAKNYTGQRRLSFRVFDAVFIDWETADEMLSNWPREKIASWREHGGQTFVDEAKIDAIAKSLEQETTPRLTTVKGKDLPKDHKDVLEWLHQVSPKTKVRLDDGAKAKSEGVVIRTSDRSKIAKIRYEDYERTLRPPQPGKKKK